MSSDSMFKFYSNENFPIHMVHQLRSLSYDVLTSYEAGQANQKIPSGLFGEDTSSS